ncbi:MAG TPA: proteasome-type protease [Pirellulales bacterium]|nr:proteasome-type protease [Pirellulales bacterium]
MTFCLGMKVDDGLVGIADTRVTSGSECITARKVTVFEHGRSSLFVMTSGLRSLRDKIVTYFEEVLEKEDAKFDRLYKAVNALAEQVRRTAAEDKQALEGSRLTFNFQALVGGQLEHDKEHKLYLLYPQANWVEVGPGTPYCIIGETGYGKPILDRTLKYSDRMHYALKVGCLAFDSTRISAANVDFPIDVVVYKRDSFDLICHRYEKQDLAEISHWWQERLRESVRLLPSDWVNKVIDDPAAGERDRTIPLSPGATG